MKIAWLLWLHMSHLNQSCGVKVGFYIIAVTEKLKRNLDEYQKYCRKTTTYCDMRLISLQETVKLVLIYFIEFDDLDDHSHYVFSQ